jgi:hypothetical protein
VQKEYYTERLKFLIEVFKLAWLSILGVGGGSAGLLLGPYDPVRYTWAVAGVVAMLAFVVVLWQTYKSMKRLWADLEGRQ